MSTIIRPVSRRIRSGKVLISLGNTHALGLQIRNSFGTSRRSFIPEEILAGILQVMIARRCQTTATTAFSVKVDNIHMANNPIGPAICNKIIAGVPINGQTVMHGELVYTILPEADMVMLNAYVDSGKYTADLLYVIQYAQANGVAFVQLNYSEPYVQPSASVRMSGDVATIATLPLETRHVTRTVLETEAKESGLGIVVSEVIKNNAGFEYAIQKYIRPGDWTLSKPAQDQIVLPFIDRDISQIRTVQIWEYYVDSHNNFGNESYNTTIHVSGQSEAFDTPSKQLGLMVPMFWVTDSTDKLDELDAVQTTLTILRPEDAQEYYGLFVSDAFRSFSIRFSGDGARTSANSTGNVDTRSGEQNTTPAFGTPISDPVRPNRLNADALNYALGQTETSEGASRPRRSSSSAQQGGRGGARRRSEPPRAFPDHLNINGRHFENNHRFFRSSV